MTQKVVPVVDTTDRADDKIIYWDADASVHKYKDESAGGASVTAQSTQLANDVSITTDSTFTDILSLSLAAGTYILLATATIQKATGTGGGNFSLRLTDGTTPAASAEHTYTSTDRISLSLIAKVTVASTTTWKLQGATGTGHDATALAANVTNAAGNTATTLIALKIA